MCHNRRAEKHSGLTHKIQFTPPKLDNTLEIYVSGATQNQIFGHMLIGYAYFLLHFCAIHAISST